MNVVYLGRLSTILYRLDRYEIESYCVRFFYTLCPAVYLRNVLQTAGFFGQFSCCLCLSILDLIIIVIFIKSTVHVLIVCLSCCIDCMGPEDQNPLRSQNRTKFSRTFIHARVSYSKQTHRLPFPMSPR